MRLLFLSFLSLGMIFTARAQSISGNLNAGSTLSALGFGNVNIYRGDELVASVLTDGYGNFNVQLDTGLYRCVVSYDGYVTSTRTVRVETDEKVDFAMAKEKGTAAARPLTTESRVADMALREHAPMRHSEAPPGNLQRTFGQATAPPATPGVLTAGEVNDFSMWTQWTGLATKDLSGLRDLWGMAPGGRHTLDLQTRGGLPIADAVVRLLRKDGSLLYEARTDNTGKAELWSALDAGAEAESGPLHMKVLHAGRTHRVDRAQPFTQRVNRLVLDVPCAPSNVVDVAFVVDATGSMQDELDFLRAEMNDIIYRSKRIGDRLNFSFANVFHRDVGAREQYTTRSMDFTRVLSTAVNFISEQRADGGGDEPEAVEVALDSAINGLAWSTEARARVLVLVLDAGLHINHGGKEHMRQLARQAAAKGIRIVPVAASGLDKSTEYLMRTLALGTNGTNTILTDHSGIGAPHVQPTTDHYDVERLNDLLVRVLRSYTYMPDCEQQFPELGLAYPDSLVQVPPAPQPADTAVTGSDGLAGVLPTVTAVRWSYYPNPTSGIVHITAEVEIPEMYITDLSGKVLRLVKGLRAGAPVQVDLGGFATGIYLIRYPYGRSWLSGKVILQRTWRSASATTNRPQARRTGPSACL